MSELVLCGRGGQGVVFLTRLLGDVATELGMDVISSETHGMAVRGGSINSHLRIGAFSSPLIRPGHADFLISLDATETGNNAHFLREGAIIVENSGRPSEGVIRRVDASALARAIGGVRLENVVLLGAVLTLSGFPFSGEHIRARLAQDPREAARKANLHALETGLSARWN
jgi:indolepyruvate ferredoxin oxidoreductase beta subunit